MWYRRDNPPPELIGVIEEAKEWLLSKGAKPISELVKKWMMEYDECHTHEDVYSVCQDYYFKFEAALKELKPE